MRSALIKICMAIRLFLSIVHGFFLLCDNKFVQILCTGSGFLHFMITHNINFCKNELRVMPLTLFLLNPVLLLMMKIIRKQTIFISFLKR